MWKALKDSSLKRECGATALEYGIFVSLVALMSLAALPGDDVHCLFIKARAGFSGESATCNAVATTNVGPTGNTTASALMSSASGSDSFTSTGGGNEGPNTSEGPGPTSANSSSGFTSPPMHKRE